MIELYGMGSPNVVKIYIALEELGLPYNVHPVDVFAGKQFDADFLKLNPMAKVPVIVDSDGPGGKPCTLFESGAILLYLAGEDRQAAAQGHGGEIRGHRVDDGADDRRSGRCSASMCTSCASRRPATSIPRAATRPRCTACSRRSTSGWRRSRGWAARSTASPTSPPIRGRAISRCCSGRMRRRNTRTSCAGSA